MTADEDSSGLLYFSACERQVDPPPRDGAGRGEGVGRQNLMEHIIENKIREAVARHRLSPKTAVNFFPLHDADGEGDADLARFVQDAPLGVAPNVSLGADVFATQDIRANEELFANYGAAYWGKRLREAVKGAQLDQSQHRTAAAVDRPAAHRQVERCPGRLGTAEGHKGGARGCGHQNWNGNRQ